MLKNWINIFAYHINNNKIFTFLNALGLSIGIAGLVFAILYWNDEHNYNAWNPEKDNVYKVVVEIDKDQFWDNMPEPVGQLLEDEVENYLYSNDSYQSDIFYVNNKKVEINKIYDTQPNFFDFFPFHFIEGNAKTALSKENYVAVSDELAQRLFGTTKVKGKTLKLKEKTYYINGVYKIPGNSSIAPEMVMDKYIKNELIEQKGQWGNFNFNLHLKLKSTQEVKKVIKKLNDLFYQNRTVHWAKEEGITPEEYIKKYGKNNFILEPLATSRLVTKSDGYPEGKGNYQFLMIMVGLSVLILVLSIFNYINLATTNAIKRAKEVGVRKILGASKRNIVFQFVFETIIIAAFSIFFALVIVELSLPFYNDFLGKKLVIHGQQFYQQLILIFLITVLVAGVFPAIYVSNFETLKVLKGNYSRSKSGTWLRNAMLVFQFGIAAFFIIGFYIVNQQIQYLSNKDLGFKGSQVLEISYRNSYDWREKDYEIKRYNNIMLLKQELMKIKGVEKAAAGSFIFGSGSGSSSSFQYKDNNIQGQNMGIDFDMLEMMQIKIKEGRGISTKFASDTINSMLVNETAAQMMQEKNPVGKEINWNENKLKIVGIVKDFNLFNPQDKVPPMAFFHFKTIDWMIGNVDAIYVKIDGKNTEQTINAIEKYWLKNVNSEFDFEYDFVDKSYARTYQKYVNQKNLFSLLNIVVILIAMFGLYSLASFSIQSRMKEIAIRKTLGAETQMLLKNLSKQYMIFCVLGFVLAIFPIYYFLNLWLENFAFRVSISVIPFIIGFFILFLLTMIVVLSKAYQATKVDVLKYLKYE
jgi:putative ABC transport system permease protein